MRSFVKSNPISILVIIIALGFILRILRLDFQPLWFDEGYSVYFSTQDPLTTAALTAQDIHPPLYYNMLGLWIRVLGLNDVNLRLFSAIAGTLTIPLFYLAARNLFNKVSVALIAAFLLAISPMHIYYSQEIRMYALVTLFATGSVYYFSELLHRPQRRLVYWIGFVVVTSLAIHTQYFAAFILASFAAFLLLYRKTFGHLMKEWWISAFGVGFIFFPWAAFAGLSLIKYVGGKVDYEGYSALNPFSYFADPLLAFGTGNAELSTQPFALAFIAVAAISFTSPAFRLYRKGSMALKESSEENQRGLILALLLVVVPLLIGWVVNLRFPFHPDNWERLFLFSLPPFLLLVAAGIEWLRERMKLGLILALLICTAINTGALYNFYTVERFASNDYRPLVKSVSALSRPGDIVLLVYPWQLGFFETYLEGQWPSLNLVPSKVWSDRPQLMASYLVQLAQGHPRIWLPAYQTLGRILETSISNQLVARDFPISDEWFGDTRLFFFAAGKEPPEKQKLVNFDDKIRLLNYRFSEDKVESGSGTVDIVLNWRAIKPLSERYTVNLRLVDEKNRTWAQMDTEPAGGNSPTDQWNPRNTVEDRHGLLIPAGTPPGDYEVKVGLSSNGERLNVLDDNNAPAGQEISLGKVTVYRSTYPELLSALSIEHTLDINMGHGIKLLGFSGGEESGTPGTNLRVSLFWQATKSFTYEDVPLHLWFEDESGSRFGEMETIPTEGKYTPDHWLPGDLMHDQQDILIPASIPDGAYSLKIGLGDGKSGVKLFDINVSGRSHSFEKPEIAKESNLRIGDLAELVGFTLRSRPSTLDGTSESALRTEGTAKPGDKLFLTLYWRAAAESTRNYTVFVHLLGPSNRMYAQRDSIPGNGSLPTTSWVTGEFLTDTYEIEIKPDAQPADLNIEIGMYDATTGQRLPVNSQDGASIGDSAIIGKLKLESSAPTGPAPAPAAKN